jgi:hypothetical protein
MNTSSSAVEHVFAGQKHRMGLIVRTIGIARARIKIGMANLAYNFQRLAWLEGVLRPHDAKTGPCSRLRHGKKRISPPKPGLTIHSPAFSSPSCRNQTVLRGVQMTARIFRKSKDKGARLSAPGS